MFRGLDLPEALINQLYQTQSAQPTDLEKWFSPTRMKRFTPCDDTAALYVWNTRLSKAFLEDTAHVEVLLRNFINDRLTADSEPFWFYDNDRYHFNIPFQMSIRKARKRLYVQHKDLTPNSIIAQLSFDSWRFLLTPRHEVTIWKALISKANGGMPHYPSRRRPEFESDVETIRQLRNRASHHEPLLCHATDSDEEKTLLDRYQQALDATARRINPEAANWIRSNSRVGLVRQLRPCKN